MNYRCPLAQPVQIRAGQQPRFESWLHHLPTVTWAWHLTCCSPVPLKMKTKAVTSLCILTDFQVSKRTCLKTKATKGSGEVAQWLKAMAILAEDLVQFPALT